MQLVLGIYDTKLRKGLLENIELTLEQAIRLCQAFTITNAGLQRMEDKLTELDRITESERPKAMCRHRRTENFIAKQLNRSRSQLSGDITACCTCYGSSDKPTYCPAFGK